MITSEITKKGKKIGDYLLNDKKLGSGTYGAVYLAKRISTGQVVAIKKICKKTIDVNSKLRSLLKTEVTIMKEIEHENIMDLYDFLETENNYYMVIQYCNEGDLSEYLENHGTPYLEEEEAVYFLKQIANGFMELRRRKVLHRDIKLENLFMHNKRIIIGDFGFAKKGASMALTKLGTPVTMAYELLNPYAKEASYDSKADLWSIGVVFYELLFGQLPFNGDSIKDLVADIEKKANGFIKFPREVSDESKNLISQILITDPESRMSWKEFFHHPLFTKFSLDLNTKSQNFYKVIGNLDMVNKIKTEKKFIKLKTKGQFGSEDAFMDVSMLVNYGNNVDMTPAKVEEEKVDIQNRKKIDQEIKFQEIHLRYSHENDIVLFMVSTIKKVQALIKSKLYLSIKSLLFDISILTFKKANWYNSRAFVSLNTNTSILDIDQEYLREMVHSSLYGKMYDAFKNNKDKMSEYKSIIQERIVLHKVKPEMLPMIETKIDDIEFLNKSITKALQIIKNTFSCSQLEETEKKAFYLALFSVHFVANSEKKFPFLTIPGKITTRFKWKKFYKAYNKLEIEELEKYFTK